MQSIDAELNTMAEITNANIHLTEIQRLETRKYELWRHEHRDDMQCYKIASALHRRAFKKKIKDL